MIVYWSRWLLMTEGFVLGVPDPRPPGSFVVRFMVIDHVMLSMLPRYGLRCKVRMIFLLVMMKEDVM